jgi:hypothetical protein
MIIFEEGYGRDLVARQKLKDAYYSGNTEKLIQCKKIKNPESIKPGESPEVSRREFEDVPSYFIIVNSEFKQLKSWDTKIVESVIHSLPDLQKDDAVPVYKYVKNDYKICGYTLRSRCTFVDNKLNEASISELLTFAKFSLSYDNLPNFERRLDSLTNASLDLFIDQNYKNSSQTLEKVRKENWFNRLVRLLTRPIGYA